MEDFVPYILTGMKIYGINTAMITHLNLTRMKPITKEQMESFCTGKEDQDDTVNDDLESIFHDIRLGILVVVVIHTVHVNQTKLPSKD